MAINTFSLNPPPAQKMTRNRQFITEIKTNALARSNRFEVILDPPHHGSDAQRLMLFAEKASIPGIQYATTPIRTYGEVRETAYDRMFEPVTITFHVDMKMTVKKVFDDWMDSIVNPVWRHHNYMNGYIRDISILVQNMDDHTTYEMKLHDAYPKSINSIALDTEAKDTMRLEVTFLYKYYETNVIEFDEKTGQELAANRTRLQEYLEDFSNFQNRLSESALGRAINGVIGRQAVPAFSSVFSRIPSLKF